MVSVASGKVRRDTAQLGYSEASLQVRLGKGGCLESGLGKCFPKAAHSVWCAHIVMPIILWPS